MRRAARNLGFLMLAWALLLTLANPFLANRAMLALTAALSVAGVALLSLGAEL